ncbi:MAG: hypothetical protein NTW66_02045 [Candidatus Magasanikbacteria bacterium]|nr:hypothetical protein [Candidatus Magasanikbacteria bacterium]
MGRESKVRIVIQVPTNHTMEVPRGTEAMVAELFEAAGLIGEYTLYLGEFVRGGPHIQGLSVRNLVEGRVIKIRVQPGSNTTSQMLKMMVPEGQDAQEFLTRLQRAEGQLAVESKSKRVQKKMRRLFRALRGDDFSITSVPQEAIEELDFDTLEALDRMLQSLARNSFLIKPGKEQGSYVWLETFRQAMAQSGYDPTADEAHERKVPKEEETEEDKVLSRVLEIEEEIELCESSTAGNLFKYNDAAVELTRDEDTLSNLLRQVETQNAIVEKSRKREAVFAEEMTKLAEKTKALKGELDDLNKRLDAIDEERKMNAVKSQAEKLFVGLTSDERANILAALAGIPA